MPARHEYYRRLSTYHPSPTQALAGLLLRNPSQEDRQSLAELMLDAYRDTIDYDGEGIAESQQEIENFFAGDYGAPLIDHSWLAFDAAGNLLSASLITFWERRQAPLVCFVMTHSNAKGKGLAAALLAQSLSSLQKATYESIHAIITEGNTPSELIHARAGFVRLPLYHWQNAPQSVVAQLDDFVAASQTLLGESLLGIYLHGSLALGCFNPARSDLDLLVVIEQALSAAQKQQYAHQLLAQSRQPFPIEMSVVTRQQLHPWRHPCPFDFHYSEDWRLRFEHGLADEASAPWTTFPALDPDLAGHINVLRARGICLTGKPIAELLPEIPLEDFHDSIVKDVLAGLEAIKDNPVYTILNSCRTLAYLQDDKILSKDEGGMWGLTNLDDSLRPTIWQAVAHYRKIDAAQDGVFSDAELDAFSRVAFPKFSR